MSTVTQPTQWLRSHRVAADTLLAGLFVGVGCVDIMVGDSTSQVGASRSFDVLAYVLTILIAAPLAGRRVRPVEALTVSMAATFAFGARGYPGTPVTIAPVIALYSVAAHLDNRRRATVTGIVSFVALSIFFFVGIVRHEEGATFWSFVGNTVIFVTAWVLGDNLYRRRQHLAHLEQRARELEHSRDLETAAAVTAERSRIARELHDVVAHSLSVMVVQAGAARRVLPRDPEATANALAQIEQTGRESLDEMRRLLGVLRSEPDAEHQPQPTIGRIPELLESEPALAISYSCTGEARAVPAAVDLSAYRIVQEALTNIRKHAAADTVDVALQWSPDSLCITIADNGRGATTLLPHDDGATHGHGILGMRERVAIVGGRLDARPNVGGGWIVRATLPLVPT